MAKEYLGEFEELVITMVCILQNDAYGAAIAEEIETRQNREVNLSAVHVTLYRLDWDFFSICKVLQGQGKKDSAGVNIFPAWSFSSAIIQLLYMESLGVVLIILSNQGEGVKNVFGPPANFLIIR